MRCLRAMEGAHWDKVNQCCGSDEALSDIFKRKLSQALTASAVRDLALQYAREDIMKEVSDLASSSASTA